MKRFKSKAKKETKKKEQRDAQNLTEWEIKLAQLFKDKEISNEVMRRALTNKLTANGPMRIDSLVAAINRDLRFLKIKFGVNRGLLLGTINKRRSGFGCYHDGDEKSAIVWIAGTKFPVSVKVDVPLL